jgi:hypothetical protein
VDKPALTIMYSKASSAATPFPEPVGWWTPNHFIPCIPVSHIRQKNEQRHAGQKRTRLSYSDILTGQGKRNKTEKVAVQQPNITSISTSSKASDI